MSIKKCISFIIVTVVLIVLSLPNSFATVNTTPITSPMAEPQPYLKTVGDHIEVSVFYVVNRPGNVNELYNLKASYPAGTTINFMYTFPSGNTSNQRVRLWSDQSPLVVSSLNGTNCYGEYVIYDVESGNLLEQNYVHRQNESGGYTISFRSGYFPRKTGIYDENDFNYGYPIIPGNMEIYPGTYPEVLNVTPFVTWSQLPPEHNIYHSVLSEPVADKYNRYFIIDDKLYWVSFRLNGAYVKVDDILTQSEAESFTSNGEYLGAISSGSGNDLISIGSQTTYKDWEVYPVTFKNQSYFDDNLMYLSLYYTNQGLQIRLNVDQMALVHALSTDKLYIEYELYVSDFALSDGSFHNSSYSSAASFITSNIQLNYDLPSEIHDIKCYGIEFLNVDNLPVNLSDVLWSYDQEFVEWRDSMLNMLTSIYNFLSGQQEIPETPTTQKWGEDVSDSEPKPPANNGEVESVYNVIDNDINQSLGESSATLHQWVDMFSIPKLIGLVAFSLAIGTAILVLGKKKSE